MREFLPGFLVYYGLRIWRSNCCCMFYFFILRKNGKYFFSSRVFYSKMSAQVRFDHVDEKESVVCGIIEADLCKNTCTNASRSMDC